MVRTQIQLTEHQARALKRLAAARGRSMADLIRASVDDLLGQPEAQADTRRRERALSAAGRFNSGVADIAENHDRYLAGIWSREHVR